MVGWLGETADFTERMKEIRKGIDSSLRKRKKKEERKGKRKKKQREREPSAVYLREKETRDDDEI